MNIALVILLVVAGIGLVLAEIFLLPGISVAGIASVLSLAGGVALAYMKLGATAGHITLAVTLVMLCLSIYLFVRSRALEKMALKTDITSKVDLLEDSQLNVGDEGVATTRLAPMGRVRIGGKEAEAKSESGFLDAGTQIIITQIEGNILTVKTK